MVEDDEYVSDITLHKQHQRYVAGCTECQRNNRVETSRNRDKKRAARELRDGVWVSVHRKCPHGTYTGYVVYTCRCGDCKAAKATYTREYRRRRRGVDQRS